MVNMNDLNRSLWFSWHKMLVCKKFYIFNIFWPYFMWLQNEYYLNNKTNETSWTLNHTIFFFLFALLIYCMETITNGSDHPYGPSTLIFRAIVIGNSLWRHLRYNFPIYMHIYMHTYIHACVCVYMYACICMYMRI